MAYQYMEIADDLRRRIRSGEFPAGYRFPGVHSLGREYGVSGGPIQEAFAVLALEGLVITRRSSGTYVLDPVTPRHKLDFGRQVYRNELGYLFNKNAGHWYPIATPTRSWVPCPADVAELLGVEPEAEILARRRIVGPGEPMQITTSYIPEDLARRTAIEEASTGPGGYLDRLEQDMGHGPLAWTTEFAARLPTEAEAADLEMPQQLPVIVLTRVATGPSRPVAADVMVLDARRFTVEYPVTRHRSARWPVSPATGENKPPRR